MSTKDQSMPDRKSHVVNWLLVGFILGVVLGIMIGFGFAPAIGMFLGIVVGVQLDMREKKILADDLHSDPSSINIHLA